MADITPLVLTGTTWSSFGVLATRVNSVISRVNALGESSDITISGGNIDGTLIGEVTPSSGVFSTLTVNTSLDLSSVSSISIPDGILQADTISGGVMTVDAVALSTAPTASNHATTKSYVDTLVEDLKNELVAYSIIFGG